jgi:hypothetical protein
MEYNSQRPELIISEYGRNIQKMIDHTLALENKDERTKAAHAIVNAMAILNPQIKDYNDFKIKLWDHLFIMSDYKLDCDSPYPMPLPEKRKMKPEKIPYPTYNIKYKHYGTNIIKMIDAAKTIEAGPAKNQLAILIANFMKQSYVNYNRDNVNDEVIIEHLLKISGGQLTIDGEIRLKAVQEFKPMLSSNNKKKKKKNRRK